LETPTLTPHGSSTFKNIAMGILQKFRRNGRANEKAAIDTNGTNTPPNAEEQADLEKEAGEPLDNTPVRIFTPRVLLMGMIVSIGGMIFGYDTGQISGMDIALILKRPS
jgi:hypothetical protein